MRESFIFYRSFYDSLSGLKEKDQLNILKAICELALNDKENIKLNGISNNIFTAIRPQILANTKKYEDGKKGGRPKNETTGFGKIKTTGFENKKPNLNVNENENVNENVNKNDNIGDSCIDGLQKIIDFYNENIGAITPYGLDILKSYAKEMPVDLIIFAMQISVEANKKTIQYIKAILNNWQKAGIKTLIEAQNETQKGKKKENFNQRKYNAGELRHLIKNVGG